MRKRFHLPARLIATLGVLTLLIVGLGSSSSLTLSQSPSYIYDDPAYPLPRWVHPAYGLNLYDLLFTHSPDKVTELQFSWIKVYHLPHLEAECPQLHAKYGVIYRIPLPSPREPETWELWGESLAVTAADFSDCIDAYEIGNEPNLAWEWEPDSDNPANPDPAAYVDLLRIAYTNIKAADPEAIVIAAAMSPTGSVPPEVEEVWDDRRFIRAMYEAGAKPYFDVLGTHPFGFKYPPETDPESIYYDPDEPYYPNNPDPVDGLCFRRAEQQRAVMEEFGDTEKQMWATEVGYVIEPPGYCYGTYDWRYRWWHVVDADTQGWYLSRAFEYAAEHWPWMGPMFVFNLDFSRAPGDMGMGCNPMSWHAIVESDGTSRPGFIHLRWVPKRPYALTEPTVISVTVLSTQTVPITVPLTLDSIGISPATWSIEVGEPWLTVAPTMATITETGIFTVAVNLTPDSTPIGIYTTAITLTANVFPQEWEAFPKIIPVQVEILELYSAVIEPPSIFVMTPITDAAPFTVPLTLQNTGLSPATWSAEMGDPWVTVAPTTTTVTDIGYFTLSVNLTETYFPGTLLGFHSTAITLTAQEGSLPRVVPIQVWVYDRLYQTYLPIVLRDD